jgi:hypothetical protein
VLGRRNRIGSSSITDRIRAARDGIHGAASKASPAVTSLVDGVRSSPSPIHGPGDGLLRALVVPIGGESQQEDQEGWFVDDLVGELTQIDQEGICGRPRLPLRSGGRRRVSRLRAHPPWGHIEGAASVRFRRPVFWIRGWHISAPMLRRMFAIAGRTCRARTVLPWGRDVEDPSDRDSARHLQLRGQLAGHALSSRRGGRRE